MYQEILLSIWSQRLLMMYELEITPKCFTQSFRRIFLTIQQKLWVKHLGVISSSYIINNRWLQIDSNISWYILSSSSLFVERGEVFICIFILQCPILINLVLCTVLRPNSIPKLNASLSNING